MFLSSRNGYLPVLAIGHLESEDKSLENLELSHLKNPSGRDYP